MLKAEVHSFENVHLRIMNPSKMFLVVYVNGILNINVITLSVLPWLCLKLGFDQLRPPRRFIQTDEVSC